MLEGLQDRLRSGVWCIRISGLENETPSNQEVPTCAKALLLKRKSNLHCFGATSCPATPLLYLYSGLCFVSTVLDCLLFTRLRYLAVVTQAASVFGLSLEFGTHRRREAQNNQCSGARIQSFAMCGQSADKYFTPPLRYPYTA